MIKKQKNRVNCETARKFRIDESNNSLSRKYKEIFQTMNKKRQTFQYGQINLLTRIKEKTS